MQRVRIGLTGLAFVFLVVLLAAVFANRGVDEAPITPNLIEHQGDGAALSNMPAPKPGPNEPLAELGVAPGKAETNLASPTADSPSPDEP